MNKLMLLLVRLAGPLWRNAGANPRALYLILRAKLLMQDRAGFMMGKQQKNQKGMEYFTYFMLFLFGGFFALTLVEVGHAGTGVGLILSFQMLYLGLLLITEMSENFFDQRDLYVLLSRPINDVTFSLARLLHVVVFMVKFGFVLGFFPFVTVAVQHGAWAALTFLFVSGLMLVLTTTGTMVAYLILLRRVPTERVKKVIGYFQIVASLIFFTAYQIPSLFSANPELLENFRLVGEPWGFVFPGLWLGATWESATALFSSTIAPAGSPSAWRLLIAQTLLGLSSAVFCGWYYLRQSRGYTDKLLSLKLDSGHKDTELAGVGAGAKQGNKEQREDARSPVRDFFARLFTRPGMERISFRFHWNMMLRDITFKQRVYPGLIYMPVILLLTMGRSIWSDGLTRATTEWLVIPILYFVLIVLVIPLGQTKVSEQYAAAWVFAAAPKLNRKQLNYGQYLAVACMFLAPTAAFCYLGVLAYWGPGFWLDVPFSLGSVLLIGYVYSLIDAAPPFSRAKDDSKFANFGPLLLIFIIAPLFGLAHWALRSLPYVLPVFTVLVWGLFLLLMHYQRKPDVAALSPITEVPSA